MYGLQRPSVRLWTNIKRVPRLSLLREKLEMCEVYIQAVIERLDGVGEKKVYLSSEQGKINGMGRREPRRGRVLRSHRWSLCKIQSTAFVKIVPNIMLN